MLKLYCYEIAFAKETSNNSSGSRKTSRMFAFGLKKQGDLRIKVRI